MPPKGVLLEEKKSRMLALLHESSDVYQLKDLEKIAPKAKGIVVQSVKDVLQNLVDDGLVCCEKIGTSNYYWSFPSQAAKAKQQALQSLEEKASAQRKRHKQLVDDVAAEKACREETPDRAMLLQQLEAAKATHAKFAAADDVIAATRAGDPRSYKTVQELAKVASLAADRWRDNVEALRDHVVRTYNMEAKAFNQAFGIPEDLDADGANLHQPDSTFRPNAEIEQSLMPCDADDVE